MQPSCSQSPSEARRTKMHVSDIYGFLPSLEGMSAWMLFIEALPYRDASLTDGERKRHILVFVFRVPTGTEG